MKGNTKQTLDHHVDVLARVSCNTLGRVREQVRYVLDSKGALPGDRVVAEECLAALAESSSRLHDLIRCLRVTALEHRPSRLSKDWASTIDL